MDILSSKERSYRMRLVKSKGTKPEWSVRRIIKNLAYKCHLHLKTLPGQPDFAFPKQKKVIFVHGCFWHRHGRCREDKMPRTPKSRLGYWREKLINNRKRDVIIQRKLSRMGWSYLVLWECQIKNKIKLEKLPERIDRFMRKTN